MIMNRHNDNISAASLAKLVDAYFEATISPGDSRRLSDLAAAICEGSVPLPEGSGEALLADLRMIAALSRSADAALLRFEADMPARLEERISSQISALAAEKPVKVSVFFRLRKAAVAAVSAAVVVAAAVGFIMHGGGDDAPLSPGLHSGAAAGCLAELVGSQSDRHSAEARAAEAVTVAPEHAVSPAGVATPAPARAVASRLKTASSATSPEAAPSHAAAESEPAAIPSAPTEIFPNITLAVVAPSEALRMPMTTLSATVNDIFESIGSISAALAGESDSFSNSPGAFFADCGVPTQSI